MLPSQRLSHRSPRYHPKTMPTPQKSDLPQGTLDLLILKIVNLGPVHGYAIEQRLEQVSRGVVQAPEGSLYPALHRLKTNRHRTRSQVLQTHAQSPRRTRLRRSQLESPHRSRLPHPRPRQRRRRRKMSWLPRLFHKNKLEHQLDKELLFHIEQHEQDLIARGVAPEEAHRRARLALGGPEQVKEKCRAARGPRWLEDLAQDTRYALRTFRQKPAFAVISILVLALGVAATTLMFGIINGVLLKPLSYPHPEQLLTLRGYVPDFGDFWAYSCRDFSDIRREICWL